MIIHDRIPSPPIRAGARVDPAVVEAQDLVSGSPTALDEHAATVRILSQHLPADEIPGAEQTIREVLEDRSTRVVKRELGGFQRDVRFAPPDPKPTPTEAAATYVRLRKACGQANAREAFELSVRHLGTGPRGQAWETLVGHFADPWKSLSALNTRLLNLDEAVLPAAAATLCELVLPGAEERDIESQCAYLDFFDRSRQPGEDFKSYHLATHKLFESLEGIAGYDSLTFSIAGNRKPGQSIQESAAEWEKFRARIEGMGVESDEASWLYLQASGYYGSEVRQAFGTLEAVGDAMQALISEHGVSGPVAIQVIEEAAEKGGDLAAEMEQRVQPFDALYRRMKAAGLERAQTDEIFDLAAKQTSTLEEALEGVSDLTQAATALTGIVERLATTLEVPPQIIPALIDDAVWSRIPIETIRLQPDPWPPELATRFAPDGAESLETSVQRMAVLYHYAVAYQKGTPETVPDSIRRMADAFALTGDFHGDEKLRQRVTRAVAHGEFPGMTEEQVLTEIQAIVRMRNLMGMPRAKAVDGAFDDLELKRSTAPRKSRVTRSEEWVTIGDIRLPIRRG